MHHTNEKDGTNVNRTERSTEIPSRRSALLAMFPAFLRSTGTAAPSPARRLAFLAPTTLLALLSTLTLFSATANADTRIPESAPLLASAAGGISHPSGLAVSAKEGGDVYVTDGGQNQRVSQFEPDGTFVRAFGWGILDGAAELQTCTTATGCQKGQAGSGPGQIDYSDEIAVDNDPASSSYGDLYVVDQRNYRVEKYGPKGEFLLMFGGEVDKGGGIPSNPGNICTAQYIANGDTCGAGVPGTGPSHFYREEPQTQAGGFKSWNHEGNNSIAVGPGGTVYVGDYGRIQEFNPEGEFAGEFSLPVKAGEEPQFVSALALDSAGDVYEHSQIYAFNSKTNTEEIVSQVPGVREYSPAHSLLRTFDAEPKSEPTHIALDSAGDLFASDFHGVEVPPSCASQEETCPTAIFRAFKPDGALYAVFRSDQVVTNGSSVPRGIAVDSSGKLYASTHLNVGRYPNTLDEEYVAAIDLPKAGPPNVEKEETTGIEPTTATLHAIINPEGFDTHYRFQYITEAKFKADGDSFGAGAEQTALTDLGVVIQSDPVQAAISGLKPGTAYRWRVFAESECEPELGQPLQPCKAEGPAEAFETLPPVSIRDFTTQAVGPELVTLKAELSPNNGSGTQYTICYGEDETYSGGCSSGEVHALGNEFEAVTATFAGLKPNTEYHYQLTAINSYGEEVKTADQTFTTELSSAEEHAAENCPNQNLREEDSATFLPDCRDYEQVSPVNKEGFDVIGHVGLAPSGQRDAFSSLGAFAGADALGSEADQYVAHRTEAGWVTHPALAFAAGPGWQLNGLSLYDVGLESWLINLVPGFAAEQIFPNNTGAYYMGRADGSFTKASPTYRTLSGASNSNSDWHPIVAQSQDLSRYFFRTTYRLLAEDPLPDAPAEAPNRIYEVAGGPSPSMRLVAEVPSGLAGTPETGSCRLDTEFALPANTSSADGSTLFYNAPLELAPGGQCETDHELHNDHNPNKVAVFACHVAAGSCVPGVSGAQPATQLSSPPPSQCHSGNVCATSPIANAHFVGDSPDGRLAWFTTKQSLIDSDTDQTKDLYLAKLTANGQLEELVQASGGQTVGGHIAGEGAGLQGVLDVSSAGTRVYFVATGLLTEGENGLHQKAAQGADNLYAYDATSGQTKFVTDLCSGPEESGSLAEPACDQSLQPNIGEGGARNDSPLWRESDEGQEGRQAQLTPDGRFLLFTSYGRLSSDDTDSTKSVFRYDFETGQLIRVSLGRRGNDGNGNDNAYEAIIPELHSSGVFGQRTSNALDLLAEDGSRAISSDGSTVVFRTAAPLVSHDTSALPGTPHGCVRVQETGCDVYQWSEDGHGTCTEAGGCISLISTGLDPHQVTRPVISASGRDITFLSTGGLVPSDTDGVYDVYDARVNGGFHYTLPKEPCGSPEACHGEGTHPGQPPTPGTETFVGPPNPKYCPKGFVKRHGHCVKVRKHHKRRRHHKRAARAANTNRGGHK
jgi:hypothetical protein